jgi:hypothetical protein
MSRNGAWSTTTGTDMSIMTATGATNPRRRARDRTTSMKPSRKKPRAKEINPTWVDVSKQWKNFGEYEHACTVIAVATANATASGSDGEVWGSARKART